MQVHRVVIAARTMLGADRIVRAETRFFERREEVVADPLAGFHQPAKRPLGARRAGVDQNPVRSRSAAAG